MNPRLRTFLNPTFAALGVAIGFALLMALGAHRPASSSQPDFLAASENLDELIARQVSKIVLPAPDLRPDEVVQLQLDGLADPASSGRGILQCYVLASPANKSVTGPLANFARIVRTGAFAELAHPQATLVGEPQIDGSTARVLVTVVDADSTIRAFEWLLSRQADAPVRDCWMTEGVMPAASFDEDNSDAGDRSQTPGIQGI